MSIRILLFEDDDDLRQLVSAFLNGQGYEVLAFASPLACAMIAQGKCQCPRENSCADILITDMHMPGMSGLELIQFQAQRGCHAPAENKLVLSSALTPGLESELRSLGCRMLRKPFRLSELLEVVKDCAASIDPGRRLTPLEALWEAPPVAGNVTLTL